MVLFTLTEITLKTTWYTLKGVYDLSYWLFYGTPESREEKKLTEIEMELKEENQKIEQLEQEIHDLKSAIQQVTTIPDDDECIP